MYGANVIIFEGILAFCSQAIRDLLDVKVFVVEDADVRLARRCVYVYLLPTPRALHLLDV
jgi:uridine kinase